MEKVKSNQILKLVFDKFANLKGFAEVKNGSTHLQNHCRFDYWGMETTFTKFRTVGVEIKVSRSDFLNDNKWPQYLKYCNEFYFTAPAGIIQPEELPEGVGLLISSTNNTTLMTKRKAAYRQIDNADVLNVFRYLIMWKQKNPFVEELIISGVKKRVGEVMDLNAKVIEENSKLIRQNDRLEAVKLYLEKADIPLNEFRQPAKILESKMIESGDDLKRLRYTMENGIRLLDEILQVVDKN